jgi:hypothetical protein
MFWLAAAFVALSAASGIGAAHNHSRSYRTSGDDYWRASKKAMMFYAWSYLFFGLAHLCMQLPTFF